MEKMAPEDILRQAELKYSQCRTYSDSGIIQMVDHRTNMTEYLKFRTWFVRPDYFRYEWQACTPKRPKDGEEFSVICRDQTGTYIKYSWKEAIIEKPLNLALAEASGSSCAAATVIPSLLMADIGEQRQSVLALDNARIREGYPDEHGGLYRIDGNANKTRTPLTVRIFDFRLDTVYLNSDTATSEHYTTLYFNEILFDQEIPLSIFELPR